MHDGYTSLHGHSKTVDEGHTSAVTLLPLGPSQQLSPQLARQQ